MSPVNIVVIHQSRTGNTRRAAELIGGAAEAAGDTVAVRPVTNIDFKELAEADLVFVGTWVDGLILFGHRPTPATRATPPTSWPPCSTGTGLT